MANINVRTIPDDLRRRFKTACADRGVNMNDRIIDMIIRDVEQYDKTKAKKAK